MDSGTTPVPARQLSPFRRFGVPQGSRRESPEPRPNCTSPYANPGPICRSNRLVERAGAAVCKWCRIGCLSGVGFINIDTSNTALFDANTTGYDPTTQGAITTTLTASTAAAAPPAGVAGANTFTATAANGQLQITSYTQSNGGANYYANTINIGNVSTANGTPAVTETAGTGTALGGLTQAAIGAGDTVGGIATGTMAGTAAPAYDSTNHTLTFYVLENDSANPGQYAYNKYVVNNFTPSTGKGYLDSVDATTSGSYTDASGNVTNTAPGGTGVSIAGPNGIDLSNFTDSPADMA